jgi:glycine betaine/choline ABC-type transport system substrate-binding protein
MRGWGVLLTLCLLTAACQQGPTDLSIGLPPTTEQAILAQMARHVIESTTNVRVQMVECQNSYACAGDLISKRIDLNVEYSAFGYMFQRHLAPTHEGSLAEVQKLYEPLGLQWLDVLGFENGYLLVVPGSRAKSLGLQTITDLNKLEGGVRVAASSSYFRQPVDGLPALLRHYGIRLRGEALLIDDSFKRLLALHDGRADVAILRATDGALRDVSLTVLADDLDFYPQYDAAIVTLTETVNSHPQVMNALGRLAGQLSPETMQGLNYQVDIEGLTPEMVASRFLRDTKLVEADSLSVTRKAEMIVAYDSAERVGALTTFVVRVVREVFPDHQVILTQTEDAVEAVAQGKARLAIIGADRFFSKTKDQLFGERETRLEAAAVLGTGYFHLIRREGQEGPQNVLSGNIGVDVLGSDRARLASLILQTVNKEPTVFAPHADLVEMLNNGEIDGALILAVSGESVIVQALTDTNLTVRSLPKELIKNLPPYFSSVRIPGGTYPGQAGEIDTVGIEVLLAGPSPSFTAGPLGGGPAAALLTQNLPLSVEQADALAKAIGNPEPPDPILPSVWVRSLVDSQGTRALTAGQNLLDTTLNLGIVLFLGWLVVLVLRGRNP